MKTFERAAAIITLLLFIAAAGAATTAQSLHLSSPVEITAAAPEPQLSAAPAPGLININTADIDALCELDGIGPALARRIVDYREEYGDFSSVAGIIDVKGIGLVTFEKIKDRITIDLS